MNNIYHVLKNEEIAKNTYLMVLEGDTSKIKRSGQFINILIDGCFLRRPISICDYDQYTITIIYKVLGEGTKKLSKTKINDNLDILVGLGNGFEVVERKSPVLVGGGVGVPPLYNLAKQVKNATIVLGFRSKEDIFYEEEFKQLGHNVIICTDDHSYGFKGNVIECLQTLEFDYYYTCGPEKMLLSLVKNFETSGQLSFEERMGCGFGACMGCSKLTKNGSIRVCKEGPVLKSEVVIND